MVLDAFVGQARIGRLTQDDRLTFTYAPTWTGARGAFPLSPPLAFEAQQRVAPEEWSARCRRFFENLLPEGQALEDLLGAYAVSRSNLFALLRILGRESTGALVLLPEGVTPDHEPGTRRELPRSELSARIRTRDDVPFSVWDGRVRLSIAGMQDKLGVLRDGDALFLVDGALATTHILKPEPPTLPHLAVNEAFCLRLAAACGLEVAAATIERVPERVLCVERFDRVRTAAGVQRVHVIDGCQALDLPVSFKYERNLGAGRDVVHVRDGVSLARLFWLATLSPAPAILRRTLLRRAVFDYLIGNADAHGKNVSFFLTPAGLRLAPAYDLVCVRAYPRFDQALAMAIGDQFDADAVGQDDWTQLALDCDLPPRFVHREVAALARAVLAVVDTVGTDLAVTGEEREALGGVRGIVTVRARGAIGRG